MELRVFRHLWGVEETWEIAFPGFVAAGYRGVETAPPAPGDRALFRSLLRQHGLDFIAGVATSGETVEAHIRSLRDQVAAAAELSPMLISCQGGRDAWDLEQASQFLEAALALEAETGLAIAHETHRGRLFFNPWQAKDLMQAVRGIRLCCDLSHWVVVTERLLTTELDIVHQAAARCIHVHARVGYEEGPQVPDPRAPEYRRHVEAHEAWWDIIWEAQESRGLVLSTLTPEFGPPAYLHTLPFTNAPVSDLHAICDWQAHRQAERFAAR